MAWNFIEHLIYSKRESESPTEYWRWAGITCLAAVMRNNICTVTHAGVIYPNIYVVLHADSGITRKGHPCKYVGKLIRMTNNTKFIAGRASIQGVIRELSNNSTNEKGMMLNGASALMYSEELSAFLVNDPASIPLLIELYDYHEVWGSTLVSANVKLKEVCLSMLSASNSELFKTVFTDQSQKGGLLGRTFVVSANKPRHRKSLLDGDTSIDENTELLLKHLQKLSIIRGIVKYTDEAKQEYDSWYNSIPDAVMMDKIGFGSRLGTHVIKIAMCLAAARIDFNCLINKDDIIEAINLCQEIRKTYKILTAGSGSSSTSYQASLIIKALVSADNYHITRRSLVQKMFGECDMDDMDKILQMLVQGGMILEQSKSNEVGYRMTELGVKKLILGD